MRKLRYLPPASVARCWQAPGTLEGPAFGPPLSSPLEMTKKNKLIKNYSKKDKLNLQTNFYILSVKLC